MAWKLFTSNEGVEVLKVEAWYWTLFIKYVRKMLKLIMYSEILQNGKPLRFLVKYKAKDKRGSNDWFPMKK